jgi:hypothetical protein
MALVNRASLGAEFYDITAARLLLQPQPQFLYAILWKMALSATLANLTGISFRGDVGKQGQEYRSAESHRANYEDPIYSNVINVVTELGNAPGHTVRLNRPKFAQTTYTQSSREIPMGTAISTTPINIESEQTSVTLKRFGGPFNQAAGAVAPFGVDRFDATKSIHSIASAVGTHLQQDFDQFIDRVVSSLLSQAAVTLFPGEYTALSDFTDAGGDGPMTYKLINRLETQQSDANLPTFSDGYRALVVAPRALEQLKDDPQFARYSEFHKPVNPLLQASYYKSVGRTHIFQSTTTPRTTNGGAGVVYENQAIVPGVIGSALGEMPRTATSTADNYGEWALVIWLMYAAFANLDSRFCTRIYTN